MTADILCYGECMVEQRTDSSGQWKTAIAGDSLNAVAAAALAGAKCIYRTAIGVDDFTEDFKKCFRGLPFSVEYEEITGLPSGRYLVTNDPQGERKFEYFRRGSAASVYPARIPAARLALDARVLFMSGITQALSPAWKEFVPAQFQAAKQAGVTTAYDINFRAALWSVEEAAAGLQDVLPHLKVLFVSEDDLPVLRWALQAKHSSVQDLFLSAHLMGPEILVLRQGKEGCAWFTKEQPKLSYLPAPQVQVVDTSGAGDVFSGVFLAAYLSEGQ